MHKQCGTFFEHDNHGNLIRFEWEQIVDQSTYLTEKIKSLSHILIPVYAETEIEFAQKKPGEVANDFMLKSLASLVQSDNTSIDWDLFKQKVMAILEDFFSHTDWGQYTGPQDINLFVIAFDAKSDEKLGVIQFLRTPTFEEKTFKAALFGVIPSAQGHGIEMLLMSSIFRLQPELKRIFLHTRVTNENAILLYKGWGFSEFNGNLPNWIDLEYEISRSTILQ